MLLSSIGGEMNRAEIERMAIDYALKKIPPLANNHLTPWRVSWDEVDEDGERYSSGRDFETEAEAISFRNGIPTIKHAWHRLDYDEKKRRELAEEYLSILKRGIEIGFAAGSAGKWSDDIPSEYVHTYDTAADYLKTLEEK